MPGPTTSSTCPTCWQPIRWTITAAGRRMAVNPDPDEGGNTAVYTDGVGTTRSRRITAELPLLPYEWQAMPHAATCANPRPRQRLAARRPDRRAYR